MAISKRDFEDKLRDQGRRVLLNLVKILYFNDGAVNSHCQELNTALKWASLAQIAGKNNKNNLMFRRNIVTRNLNNDSVGSWYKEGCLRYLIKAASSELNKVAKDKNYPLPALRGISEKELYNKIIQILDWEFEQLINDNWTDFQNHPIVAELLVQEGIKEK